MRGANGVWESYDGIIQQSEYSDILENKIILQFYVKNYHNVYNPHILLNMTTVSQVKPGIIQPSGKFQGITFVVYILAYPKL